MEKYNWQTSFDQKNGLMIHDFDADIKVVTDFNKSMTTVFKKGEVNRILSANTTLKEYSNLLVSIAKDAEKLKSFQS